MSKSAITVDDIFGRNENLNQEQQEHKNINDKKEKNIQPKKYKTKNTNKNDDKISNTIPNSISNSNSNANSNPNSNPKIDSITNNIDNILNNGLVKFENKIQTSMFFVCYKAMNAFCNDIKNTHNIIIPKEFIDKQVISIIPNIIKEYTGNLKKRCKKVINLDMICIGRKLDNKQCTRKKHNDSDFCKSHFIKLSNGRIDQPTQINLRNKRGRKRKVEFDPRQYDNEYITLWEDIINGEKVLIDINNNIYTFDMETPQYIGKKDIFNKLDITSILNNIATSKKEDSEKIIKKELEGEKEKEEKEDKDSKNTKDKIELDIPETPDDIPIVTKKIDKINKIDKKFKLNKKK